MIKAAPVTVVEMPSFAAAVSRMMSFEERVHLIDYLARNPRAGDVITGAGGIRKLRWALPGRGKSGGARVIYYFHGDATPLFALAAYAKNERADLSQADRNNFRRLTERLVESYSRRMV